jgi:hypothetical protein
MLAMVEKTGLGNVGRVRARNLFFGVGYLIFERIIDVYGYGT